MRRVSRDRVPAALGTIGRPLYDPRMARFIIGIAAVLALAWATPAQARQGDPRLDALFERLLATEDYVEAKTIEAEIWVIWIESGDDTLDGLMNRGIEAMSGQDFGVALESFNGLIESAPDFAEGWNKRATLYYLIGKYEASIDDVVRTLALEPRHFGALSGMGLIQTALDDEKAALKWFERALAVNPHLTLINLRVKMLRDKLKGTPI